MIFATARIKHVKEAISSTIRNVSLLSLFEFLGISVSPSDRSNHYLTRHWSGGRGVAANTGLFIQSVGIERIRVFGRASGWSTRA
jgi:hypothetical protein